MSTSGSISGCPHQLSKRCFMEWMNLQQEDLDEFLRILHGNDQESESVLNHLKDKAIQNFQDYMDKRKELAKTDVSSYFSPSWISTLENSLLWVAGCRPSAFIRLLYTLCGSDLEKNLTEQFIQGGVRAENNLGSLTWKQLGLVNELHQKIVKLEDKLSNQLASFQEDVADRPIAIIARGEDEKVFAVNEVVKRAFKCHDKDMLNVLEEADKLRLSTLKELISILTPVQAVNYLAASKKLHLSLHQWGKTRDHMHGRTNVD